jgi:hypothetical protein
MTDLGMGVWSSCKVSFLRRIVVVTETDAFRSYARVLEGGTVYKSLRAKKTDTPARNTKGTQDQDWSN